MTSAEHEMTDPAKMTDAELNEWMAEHVGGWTEHAKGWQSPSGAICLGGCPNYTGSGDLVLEVVHRLLGSGWSLNIEETGKAEHEDHPQVYVSITRLIGTGMKTLTRQCAYADLPRALCELTKQASDKGWLKKEPTND